MAQIEVVFSSDYLSVVSLFALFQYSVNLIALFFCDVTFERVKKPPCVLNMFCVSTTTESRTKIYRCSHRVWGSVFCPCLFSTLFPSSSASILIGNRELGACFNCLPGVL